MSRTKQQYQQRLANMLPPGIDWLRVDARIARLLLGLGSTGARVDGEAEDFEADAVPTSSTGDALSAWETALRLPDVDRPAVDPGDVAARQEAVRVALDQSATATPALFVALAGLWTIVVTVDEPSSNPSEVWIYGPSTEVKVFRCGSHAGDHIKEATETWTHVENLILRYVPAHVRPHFVDEIPS